MSRLIATAGLNIGLTSAFTKSLEKALPRHFASRNVHFRYAGHPFHGWPHPLVWTETVRKMIPRSRLLRAWGPLTCTLYNEVQPWLNRGGYSLIFRCGYDALTFSRADMPSEAKTPEEAERIRSENAKAVRMHHEHIVPMVVRESFPIPLYLVVCAKPEDVTEDWIARVPKLTKRVEIERIRRFVVHELEGMRDYFSKKWNQLEPIYIPATLTESEMVAFAIAELDKRFTEQKEIDAKAFGSVRI